MNTDELIAALSRSVEPIDRQLINRRMTIALAMAVVVAIGIVLIALGVRTDLRAPRAIIFMSLKLAFAIGTVGGASYYLARLMRPGGERRASVVSAALPFAATLLLAAVSLGGAPKSHWDKMVMGDEWLECLISIPVIAIVPFAVVIWTVENNAAPTSLVRAAAISGLIAGGASAVGYALHCTDDSLPLVALWYGGTIAICTIVGALLGPRMLRW